MSVRYGIDAPGVVRNMALAGLGCFGLAALLPRLGVHGLSRAAAITGTIFTAEALAMLWTSLRGKRIAARQLVEGLGLDGSERVLDLGCGRGLLLVETARRLPSGRAVGLDLWNAADLSGNARAATEANLRVEGVEARAELIDGDMRALPFESGSFDAVVSSLAVHNVYDPAERAKALVEIVRVLKPGGRVLVQDFRHTRDYAAAFEAAGFKDVTRRLVSPFLMFPPTWRVEGVKP
jgi:ubiquinone/menaquinone biosynthesis C-methylase UbiE